MSPEAMLSVKDKLKKAKPQRRSHRMNLRGDIVVQIQELELALESAREMERDKRERGTKERLYPQGSESVRIAQQIQDLEAEMGDGWLDLTLEAVPWAQWRDFKLENPKDENDEQDANIDFHFSALVESDLLKKSVVEPELDAEDWDQIFTVCSPADLRELGLQCYLMHERSLDVPKSLRASAVLAQSGAGSKPQQGSESPSDDSTAGSPKSGTSTTAPTEAESEQQTPTSP